MSSQKHSIQTAVDVTALFFPIVNMFIYFFDAVYQMLQFYENYENAKDNEKTCAAILERVEIAQTAVKSFQHKYQTNETIFSNPIHYNAWVRLINVLENIRKFTKEFTQLTYFQKFFNAKAVKNVMEKNIKEFEKVCNDLNFAIGLYNVEQRDMEAHILEKVKNETGDFYISMKEVLVLL
ncbi:26204_t:CDS:1 [Gigaspora margarita]|uniref:26204_t:CDS:1 n=1 Tax=Gigaspora margarita TaxID=4874 RepID=A0ABM8W465_GIGMA|nr:26204_t:CDS:1 [Gigaspora margarita]